MARRNGSGRALLVGAACGCLALMASCKGGGGSSAATSEGTAPRPSASTSPREARYEGLHALGYRPQWNAPAVVGRGQRVRFVDAFDDMVVVHESGNTVTVMEPSTGRARWSLDLAGPLAKFVGNVRTIDGDLLSCAEDEVFLLDPRSGVIKARQRLAVLANTPPVIADGIAVFGCANGEVLGHNLISGYKQWGHALRGAIEGRVVPIGPFVGAVSQGGDVVVLNPETGESVGRNRVFEGLDNSPASSDWGLFIAGRDRSVWAFAGEGGAQSWRVRTSHRLRDQPVHHDGRVYVVVPVQGMTAIDAFTGEVQWTNDKVQSGSVVGVRGDRLLVWDGSALHALDMQRGDTLITSALPGIGKVVTDAFESGNLYLAEPGGTIQKFSPR